MVLLKINFVPEILIDLITVILTLTSETNGFTSRNDVHRMMYQSFDHPTSCFRRLNGTHQFGCSTPRSGSFGVIHLVNDQNDVDWLLEKGQAGPYMAVLTPAMFNRDVLRNLDSHQSVSGVLLIVDPEEDPPPHYSPDDICPNRYSSEGNCSSERPWNPSGSYLLLKNWNIPIFTVNNPKMIQTILECNRKFNLPLDDSQTSRGLCSLHMKAHMFAAVDSGTCMRRSSLLSFNPMKFCDPLADQNIYLSIGNPVWQENNVIVVAARFDSASMFDGIAPGAMGSVTGFVTLITTAHILYKAISSFSNTGRSFIFLLLNGEGFDYIGSSKVVFDMQRKQFPSENFPLDTKDLEFFVDISQLDNNSSLFLHYHKTPAAETFSEKLKNYGSKWGLRFTNSPSTYLPPVSLQTFHKARNSLPGLVISNFKEKFVNKYYHGLFDTGDNLGYKYANGSEVANLSLQFNLASIADSLARTLYSYISTDDMPQQDLQTQLVDELLYCYLENSNCKLLQTLVGGEMESAKSSFPLYIGVGTALNRITRLTGLLLASLTSPRINLTEEECSKISESSKIYSSAWIYTDSGGGECINTTLKFTPALSPAFQIEDYNWTSGMYSTWTESVWQEITLQMFIKPSRSQELLTLISGLTTLVFSSLAVYLLSTRGQGLFVTSIPVNC